METNEKSRLLSEFPAHTAEQWKEAAIQLLKGRPFEKTLVTPTYEGFDLQPIYTREAAENLSHLAELPGRGSQVRGSRLEGYLEAGWRVSQELSAPTPEGLNAIAQEVLTKGQDELNVWLDKPTRSGEDVDGADSASVGVCGVSLNTRADVEALLEDLDLEKISLYLQAGSAAPAVYAQLMAALRERGADTAGLEGCLGMDPVGWLAEEGTLAGDPETIHAAMAGILKHAAANAPKLQVLDVKGHAYHNGGASSTQEMAAVLATAVAYLKALAEAGIPATDVIPRMRLSVSVGANYFIEIAKLRALRMLWNRVMEAFGVPEDSRKVHIHARTGLWNKTVFDPYVNMLRTTTEAFSAVVGGCDSLHVGHFDELVRESDEFARRIARNTHAILAEECDMRRVVDPAGGSWAVESLTDQMAAEAWKQFQEIEAAGGILAALESGTLQASVEAVRLSKAKNIQRRKDVIVGTNSYPNASEELLKPGGVDYASFRMVREETLAEWKASRDGATVKEALAQVADAGDPVEALVNAADAGATIAELMQAAGLGQGGPSAKPVTLNRAAEEFEKLRIAAKGMEAAGRPPLVHQLNMGPSRRYRIRADWTSAFFQVGGLKVLNEEDYERIEEAVEAFLTSGATVAIITSDDETYGSVVVDLARALKEAGSGVTVLVAGAPGDNEAAWRKAGVDDFVNVRVNNYQFNRALLEGMGASL
jgi:methylmalonyl-CoA mutase